MTPDVKHESEAAFSLNTVGAFKFWRIQKRNAAKLLKEIIFRWRGASAFVRGTPGKWVVWPRERWSEWTGLSRNQLDRALKELVDTGLINRERHRFAGSEVRTFLQPTQLGLKYAGKPQDIGHAANEKPDEKLGAKSTEKTVEAHGEKITEKSFLTSLPSYSSKTPSANNLTASPNSEGSDVIGEDYKELNKDVGKSLIEKLAENKKKQQQAEKELFPEKKGPHEKYVRHPSKMFKNWSSFSSGLKVTLYSKYLAYVDNWYSGKKGQQFILEDELMSPEDEAALIAAYDKTYQAKKESSKYGKPDLPEVE